LLGMGRRKLKKKGSMRREAKGQVENELRDRRRLKKNRLCRGGKRQEKNPSYPSINGEGMVKISSRKKELRNPSKTVMIDYPLDKDIKRFAGFGRVSKVGGKGGL